MYVGDSITHGYQSASYRWALHKILVDNNISYDEVGYNTNNTGGDLAGDSYRGVAFKNVHSATSGIRAWDVAGKTSKTGTEYVNAPIKGILDSTSASTFMVLLGTNDLLSDNNPLTPTALTTVTDNLLGSDRSSGDIGHIVDALYESNPNATVYMATIPAWTHHNNNDTAEPHTCVAEYNESLEGWVSNYNKLNRTDIVLIDINKGLIDVAAEKPFYGVYNMFRSPSADGLHPNTQGELIIAGNMARAMGFGGRTAGAERKAATDFSRVVNNVVTDGSSNLKLNADSPSLSFAWSEADSSLAPDGGFTAELLGFTFGNGELNNWNTDDDFTFTIGNGSGYGALSINEAYIKWGDTVLFSDDMSALTENIRMAYVAGDSTQGIAGGYYVWLGDMLIGEALSGTASSAVNGVTLSYSGASFYTLQGLAMDSTGTYAPSIGVVNVAPPNGSVVVPNNVVWAAGTPGSNNNGTTFVYANSGSKDGDVWYNLSSGTYTAWVAAHGGSGTLDGNVTMLISDAFNGDSTAFGVVNPTSEKSVVKGDVSLQFDATGATYGTFTTQSDDVKSSIVGSYQADIEGTFRAVINAGTFNYHIYGGVHTGEKSIGATEIFVNGGTINGNVYAGNLSSNGTIAGNTALIVSSLAPFANHSASHVLSPAGKGGTIQGDAVLTFRGVNGLYAGNVSGEGNSTVVGASVLKVTENSALTLTNVQDFDSIVIDNGSSLTVNGAITTDTVFTYAYDPATAASKTDNGLGAGVRYGLVSGEGILSVGAGATLNGEVIRGMTEGNGFIIEDNSIYYVMHTTKLDMPTPSTQPRGVAVYSLADGTEILMSDVVHVGNHSYSGPEANPDANTAKGFYVDKNGVLAIMGDINEMLAGDILETTQGSGDIILRSPGYTDIDGLVPTMIVSVDSKVLATGNLYLAPYELNAAASPNAQPGVFLHLNDDADISSFREIHYGYPQSQIIVNGLIGQDENGAHFNNIHANGCGTVYLGVNHAANDRLVLAGETELNGFAHGNGGSQPTTLYLDVNHADSQITIEKLSGKHISNWNYGQIMYTTRQYGAYGTQVDAVNGVLNIDSFDFEGYVRLFSVNEDDNLHINLTVQDNQVVKDTQLIKDKNNSLTGANAKGEASLTLYGSGKYILSDGNSIDVSTYSGFFCTYNFAKLSTEYAADGVTRLWTGTVEVNNLVAMDGYADTTKNNGIDFTEYGNEQSTIHFKGFKGHVYQDGYLNVTIGQDLILTDSSTMSAFELGNGYSEQQLHFEGDISGTGDFVINTSATETVNFKGNVANWQAEDSVEQTPAVIVKQGGQAVNFSDEATVINADLLTTGGTMKAGISNDAAVTVNSRVSHEGGGALEVTVNTAQGTTFNNKVDIDKLAVATDSVARFAGETAVGTVGIAARHSSAAVVQNGMTIERNTVNGGSAANAALRFESVGSISNASLEDVSLASLQAGASINMSAIVAKDVYLAGAANFVSLDAQQAFRYTETITAFDKQYNEVAFTTNSFKGMMLEASLAGDITLTVAEGVDLWAQAAAEALTNVTITLTGFRVEGMQNGDRVDAWFSPLNILSPVTQEGVLLADNGTLTVAELLNPDAYLFKYYEQTANGLIIRMSNIPEPTTATLSMLALAALAARRRRR